MGGAASAGGRPAPPAAGVKPSAAGRLLFIDNIRVFLTILVILQHLMVTYAGTGSWFYKEDRQDFITAALGQWFCAVNQAFFMSFFFMISAYFMPASYDRKGPGRFLSDRLIRLGIPLVIFSWLIEPLLNYVIRVWLQGAQPFTNDLLGHFNGGTIIGGGPLWFVEVLLIFACLYVLWRALATGNRNAQPAAQPVAEARFPSTIAIVGLFAALMSVATFVVRLPFRVDSYNFTPLNLQFPFFAQYIILFVVGLVAYRRDWLAAWRIGRAGAGCGWRSCWYPALAADGAAVGALDDKVSFKGGRYWQSLVYAFWEAFFPVACASR